MENSLSKMDLAATGIIGLDDVLSGGFSRNRVYLVEGSPGTGKTTLALQYLMQGAKAGEKSLYISLSETEEELRATAVSHGWSLENISVFELLPPENLLDQDQRQSLLYSSDLELGETTKLIFETIDRVKPQRIVLDSLSELRLLAQGSLRYRRQLLALKHYFSRQNTTVLMLDDMTSELGDRTVHSIVHGVVHLEELSPLYGAERRQLKVIKYRGMKYRGGYHDFVIATGGVKVFPRLVASEHKQGFAPDTLHSGLTALDNLLGGGLDRGSSTLLIGPSGSGKSLVALQFVMAALTRGEKVAFYVFDEEIGLFIRRAKGMGIDLEAYRALGTLFLEQVDAAEVSPGEFSHKIRDRIEQNDVKTLIIDSLNGYQAAMPEEQFLILHMHELLTYLNRQGISSILTVAQHGLVGDMRTPFDITYLSDTVILLRFFETFGSVRRAISVVKKRTGYHESTIREFQITEDGLGIGQPLVEFQGVLRGVPNYVGETSPLMNDPKHAKS